MSCSYLLYVHLYHLFLFDVHHQMNDQHYSEEESER